MGNPGRTESHLMLRTPESQPEIRTPWLKVSQQSYRKGKAAISSQVLFPLRCGQRNRGEKKKNNTECTVHALSHITLRVVIREGLIFIPMKQLGKLRFKNVKKFAQNYPANKQDRDANPTHLIKPCAFSVLSHYLKSGCSSNLIR